MAKDVSTCGERTLGVPRVRQSGDFLSVFQHHATVFRDLVLAFKSSVFSWLVTYKFVGSLRPTVIMSCSPDNGYGAAGQPREESEERFGSQWKGENGHKIQVTNKVAVGTFMRLKLYSWILTFSTV